MSEQEAFVHRMLEAEREAMEADRRRFEASWWSRHRGQIVLGALGVGTALGVAYVLRRRGACPLRARLHRAADAVAGEVARQAEAEVARAEEAVQTLTPEATASAEGLAERLGEVIKQAVVAVVARKVQEWTQNVSGTS